MDNKDSYKPPSEMSAQHIDDYNKEDISTIPTAEFPDKLAEQVSYGPGGIKGLFSSPYVSAAAFLASLGRFLVRV